MPVALLYVGKLIIDQVVAKLIRQLVICKNYGNWLP
jgi:hypothetical protein